MSKRLLAISNHAAMIGGGEHSFLDLVSHLPPEWEVRAIVPAEGELAFRLRAKGIPATTLPLPSLRPWHIHVVVHALRSHAGTLTRYRPHLIYANGPRAVFYGGIAGRFAGIPVIWHCRIADTDPLLDWILSRLSRRIIANSHATAKRFGARLQKKVEVIHNGVDLQWLNEDTAPRPSQLRQEWKVVLVVARISRAKRYDLALTAFERIADAVPDSHLVCIGAKDQQEPARAEALQQRSLRSAFSDRIHWMGQVEDLRPWYRAANLLLLPSENEAFGRVIVEAMACGVPVVATKSGGVPEIVTDGVDGLLVPPGDSGELAKALLRILDDQALRTKLGLAARKRAQNFDLSLHLKRMTALFEQMAAPRAQE